VAAVQRADRGLQAAGGQELHRGQHAAVDAAGLDVAPPALVDLDVGVVEHALLQGLLAHEQQLADRGLVGVRAEERVLARGAVDGGGLQQLPAVEDRLGVDQRGALAGRADLEQHVRGVVGPDAADAPEDRAGHHRGAAPQRAQVDVVALEAVDLGEERPEGR
jgi:hypothetical protein